EQVVFLNKCVGTGNECAGLWSRGVTESSEAGDDRVQVGNEGTSLGHQSAGLLASVAGLRGSAGGDSRLLRCLSYSASLPLTLAAGSLHTLLSLSAGGTGLDTRSSATKSASSLCAKDAGFRDLRAVALQFDIEVVLEGQRNCISERQIQFSGSQQRIDAIRVGK